MSLWDTFKATLHAEKYMPMHNNIDGMVIENIKIVAIIACK